MSESSSEARTIICRVCEHLQRGTARDSSNESGLGYWAFAEICETTRTDLEVLLNDATGAFCRAVSQEFGEEPSRRWSDFLPEFLLIHPERCEEILSLIERENFEQLPYLELAGSLR